jgi:hypothetical protein
LFRSTTKVKTTTMKKLLFTLSLIGVASAAYAQGQINLGNISNSGTGPTATTGGLFWVDLNSPQCPPGPTLITTDFNVNFYGGSDANSLVLLKSIVNSGGGAAGGPGTFLDLSGQPVSIPGALTSAVFRIEAWIGTSTTFLGPGTIAGASSPVFSNPLGNPTASPPGTPTDFTSMPAMVIQPLSCVPEPSTFALAAIGAAALLIFRRRNS